MAKAKSLSPAKEKLLKAAEELMITRGYVATSADDICHKAKVNRGSFFYYFKTKDDLAKELIERFSKKVGAEMCCGVSSEKDPLKRVYRTVDNAIQMTKNPNMKGCLVGTLAQEISDSHPGLRACCETTFKGGIQMLKGDLEQAKKKYASKADFDTKGLAETFLAIAQGANILRKATKDKNLHTRALEHYKRYLKYLFGR